MAIEIGNKFVPCWLHALAVPSPGCKELDEDSLASGLVVPVVGSEPGSGGGSEEREERAARAFERASTPILSNWLAMAVALCPMLACQLMVEFKVAAALCYVALCVAAFVVSSCHTGSTATQNPASPVAKLDTAKAAAEEALVQSLLQVRPACLPSQ